MEDIGEARNRSNSIIKEPFDSFPENIIILKITKLISEWLMKIEKDQEIFNKDIKHKEKLKD